jgi:hypothetical protein
VRPDAKGIETCRRAGAEICAKLVEECAPMRRGLRLNYIAGLGLGRHDRWKEFPDAKGIESATVGTMFVLLPVHPVHKTLKLVLLGGQGGLSGQGGNSDNPLYLCGFP